MSGIERKIADYGKRVRELAKDLDDEELLEALSTEPLAAQVGDILRDISDMEKVHGAGIPEEEAPIVIVGEPNPELVELVLKIRKTNEENRKNTLKGDEDLDAKKDT